MLALPLNCRRTNLWRAARWTTPHWTGRSVIPTVLLTNARQACFLRYPPRTRVRTCHAIRSHFFLTHSRVHALIPAAICVWLQGVKRPGQKVCERAVRPPRARPFDGRQRQRPGAPQGVAGRRDPGLRPPQKRRRPAPPQGLGSHKRRRAGPVRGRRRGHARGLLARQVRAARIGFFFSRRGREGEREGGGIVLLCVRVFGF